LWHGHYESGKIVQAKAGRGPLLVSITSFPAPLFEEEQ
jgi:hypothetical protein